MTTEPTPTPVPHDRTSKILDVATTLALVSAADPETAAREVSAARALLSRVEHMIADERPAIPVATFRRDYGNDPETLAEVTRWRDTYNFTDVSELPTDDDGEDPWTIEAGGSSRYEVREVERYEARRAPDVSGSPFWYVWDTDTDERAQPYAFNDVGHDDEPDDEGNQRAACAALNIEDYRTNACGWPFAHNYAAQIGDYEAERFARAGFVVARYRDGQLYAGIDGGGYDFLGAHWLPAYLDVMTHYGSAYVRTRDGVRKVVKDG